MYFFCISLSFILCDFFFLVLNRNLSVCLDSCLRVFAHQNIVYIFAHKFQLKSKRKTSTPKAKAKTKTRKREKKEQINPKKRTKKNPKIRTKNHIKRTF